MLIHNLNLLSNHNPIKANVNTVDMGDFIKPPMTYTQT